jgi:predicted RNase H-like HicB family nuclease
MSKVEIEQEADGRWIAQIPELPGVLAYGASKTEARARVLALARRVIAERHQCAEQ